jgi:hypothetical protein
MTYDVRNHVKGNRFDVLCGDQRIVVDRTKAARYVQPTADCRIRHRGGLVYLLIGSKQLEMTTPAAVKLGIALATNGGACTYLGDIVSLNIAGEELTLLPQIAVKLGGLICKKADRADDFQRGIST